MAKDKESLTIMPIKSAWGQQREAARAKNGFKTMTKSHSEKLETRVDAAHGQDSFASLPEAEGPTLDVLKSIAGINDKNSAKQICAQSIELAAYLQDKQKILDRRESELNARLAMLETEERAYRIRVPEDISRDSSCDTKSATIDCGIALDEIDAEKLQPHNEGRLRRFALHADREYSNSHDETDVDSKSHSDQTDLGKSTPHTARSNSDLRDDRKVSLDVNDLQTVQQALMERESNLARKEKEVSRLHDQVSIMYRESLELRLATEQLWNDLGKSMSDEKLAANLSEYRHRLNDHYKMYSEELSRRSIDLQQRQKALVDQANQLRRQRLEVQVWVDKQRNSMESKSAQLAAREVELNRYEVDFQKQTILWQKQREEYRREIQQLSQRLRSSQVK